MMLVDVKLRWKKEAKNLEQEQKEEEEKGGGMAFIRNVNSYKRTIIILQFLNLP